MKQLYCFGNRKLITTNSCLLDIKTPCFSICAVLQYIILFTKFGLTKLDSFPQFDLKPRQCKYVPMSLFLVSRLCALQEHYNASSRLPYALFILDLAVSFLSQLSCCSFPSETLHILLLPSYYLVIRRCQHFLCMFSHFMFNP
jgi:hypothetical protein